MNTSISEKGEWLSDKLIPIDFDIDQSGNVRKTDKAEAFYCCICVSKILKEDEFRKEVNEVTSNYVFFNYASE